MGQRQLIAEVGHRHDIDQRDRLFGVSSRPAYILHEHDVEPACGRNMQQFRFHQLRTWRQTIPSACSAHHLASVERHITLSDDKLASESEARCRHGSFSSLAAAIHGTEAFQGRTDDFQEGTAC